MKVKKDSEIKTVSSGLSLGGSVIHSSKQVIRTGLSSSSNPDEDEQQTEPDGYMQYLTRHQKNMLKRLSPRSKKRYNRMLKKQKEVNGWSRTIQQRQSSFQDHLKRSSSEASHESAHTAASSGSISSGGAAASAGSGTASTTASGAAAAGGTAAAGAATGGVAIAGAAAAEASKKVAEKVKDSLAAMAAERHAQMQDISKSGGTESSGKQPIFGWAKEGKRPEGEAESHAIMYIGVLLIIVVLLINMSSSYIVDLSIDHLEAQEEDWNLISVAKTELSQASMNLGGYKYKNWYGMDGNWCAMFVSYCADQCGYIESGVMPKTASVSNMIEWYRSRGEYWPAGVYTPKGGDIIFFGNGMSHTGIVISFDPDKNMVMVIEGNSGSSSTTPYHEGSRVRVYSYSIHYKYIVGYGTPNFSEE